MPWLYQLYSLSGGPSLLSLKSPHDRKHASLEHGAAAGAAVWPEKLCYAILRGMRKQLLHDNVMHEGEIGTVSEDPIEK